MSGAGGRLEAVAGRLRAHRLSTGAWGQRPAAERGNVIAAAQALRVLRAAGAPLADADVAATVTYLADNGVRHAAPVERGGRGEFSRYVTASLEGLVEYPEARGNPSVRERIERHIEWLRAHRVGGGWGESPEREPSAFATARALIALRRAGADHEIVGEAAETLLVLAHPRGGWAVQGRAGDVSPAVTGLAITALSGLNAPIDARLGQLADRLLRARGRWLRQVEYEQLPGVRWVHPSFAIVVDALGRLGRLDAQAEQATREFLDEIWDEASGGWILPGERVPTIAAACAVVVCFEGLSAALFRAVSADPLRAAVAPAGGGAAWTITLLDDHEVIASSGEHSATFALRPRLWDLLEALAAISEGQPRRVRRGDVRARHGSEPGTFSKEMSRLRAALAKQTGGRVSTLAEPAGNGWLSINGSIVGQASAAPPDTAPSDDPSPGLTAVTG